MHPASRGGAGSASGRVHHRRQSAYPASGGTSPAVNPQVKVATDHGARNTVPYFVTINGPVREARYKYNPDGTRDGGVHALFVISGRKDDTGDASTCNIVQENFWAQGQSNKLIARALSLSPHTVKRHMARIFDKTGQASRGQVAAWYTHHTP